MIAPALAPLTPLTALTAWRLRPGVLAAVAALGGGYGVGLRRRGAKIAERFHRR